MEKVEAWKLPSGKLIEDKKEAEEKYSLWYLENDYDLVICRDPNFEEMLHWIKQEDVKKHLLNILVDKEALT